MLTLRESAHGDVTVLTLQGRVVLEDLEAPLAATLDRLMAQGQVRLVLDLSDVTYIDSAGLGLLVSRYVRAQKRGGDLRFVRPTVRSQHLLHLTKLATVFRTFDTADDAVRSYAASA